MDKIASNYSKHEPYIDTATFVGTSLVSSLAAGIAISNPIALGTLAFAGVSAIALTVANKVLQKDSQDFKFIKICITISTIGLLAVSAPYLLAFTPLVLTLEAALFTAVMLVVVKLSSYTIYRLGEAFARRMSPKMPPEKKPLELTPNSWKFHLPSFLPKIPVLNFGALLNKSANIVLPSMSSCLDHVHSFAVKTGSLVSRVNQQINWKKVGVLTAIGLLLLPPVGMFLYPMLRSGNNSPINNSVIHPSNTTASGVRPQLRNVDPLPPDLTPKTLTSLLNPSNGEINPNSDNPTTNTQNTTESTVVTEIEEPGEIIDLSDENATLPPPPYINEARYENETITNLQDKFAQYIPMMTTAATAAGISLLAIASSCLLFKKIPSVFSYGVNKNKPIACTAYINTLYLKPSIILGEDESWNRLQAPYLYDDFKLENGEPLILDEGTYLVPMNIFPSNCEQDTKEFLAQDGGIYLPGSILYKFLTQETITLKYKGQPIQITIHNQKAFTSLLKTIENHLYPSGEENSSKPHSDAEARKVYSLPDFPYLEEIRKIRNAITHASEKKENITHYKFNAENNGLEKVDQIDFPEKNDLEIESIPLQNSRGIILEARQTKEMFFSIFDGKLLIYKRKSVPISSKKEIGSYYQFSAAVIDIKELKVDQETVLKNLKATYEDGNIKLLWVSKEQLEAERKTAAEESKKEESSPIIREKPKAFTIAISSNREKFPGIFKDLPEFSGWKYNSTFNFGMTSYPNFHEDLLRHLEKLKKVSKNFYQALLTLSDDEMEQAAGEVFKLLDQSILGWSTFDKNRADDISYFNGEVRTIGSQLRIYMNYFRNLPKELKQLGASEEQVNQVINLIKSRAALQIPYIAFKDQLGTLILNNLALGTCLKQLHEPMYNLAESNPVGLMRLDASQKRPQDRMIYKHEADFHAFYAQLSDPSLSPEEKEKKMGYLMDLGEILSKAALSDALYWAQSVTVKSHGGSDDPVIELTKQNSHSHITFFRLAFAYRKIINMYDSDENFFKEGTIEYTWQQKYNNFRNDLLKFADLKEDATDEELLAKFEDNRFADAFVKHTPGSQKIRDHLHVPS